MGFQSSPQQPRPTPKMPTHIGSDSSYLLPAVPYPHPQLPVRWLAPAPTFDGGVDEDDTAHG